MQERSNTIGLKGYGELIFKTINIYSTAIGKPLNIKINKTDGILTSDILYTDFNSVFVNIELLENKYSRQEVFDRLDHILGHLVFKTNLVLLNKLVRLVSKKLVKSPMFINKSLSEDAIGSSLTRLMLSIEDSRIIYQWGLRYPGSAGRVNDRIFGKMLSDCVSSKVIEIYENVDCEFSKGSILGTTRRFKKIIQEWIKSGTILSEIVNLKSSEFLDKVHNDIYYPNESSDSISDLSDSKLLESIAFNDEIDQKIEDDYSESVKGSFDLIDRASSSGGEIAVLSGYKSNVVNISNEVVKSIPDPQLVSIFRKVKRRKNRIRNESGTIPDIQTVINNRLCGIQEPPFNVDSNRNGFELVVLLDKSKSMVGIPFETAFSCAKEICSSSVEAGVKIKVLGFTSTRVNGELLIEDYASGVYPDMKHFGSTPLHAAIDYVSKTFTKSSDFRKRALIILTDGDPNFTNLDGSEVKRDAVVQEMRASILKLTRSGIVVHSAIIPAGEDEDVIIKNFEGVCTTSKLRKNHLKSDLQKTIISVANLL